MTERSDTKRIPALPAECPKEIDVIDSEAMRGSCTVAQVHGFRWSRPTINTTSAKELLAKCSHTRD